MVAILLIGDEILSAGVREENLHFMLTSLTEIGYQVGEVRIVRDEVTEIATAFRELQPRYEYLFSAGGIGPTHDDITLQGAAEAFGVPLEQNQQMLAFLKARYGEPLSPMVARMAELPVATQVEGCSQGRWPVIQWHNVFILPGLPRALQDKMRRIAATLPHRDRMWTIILYLSADESDFADWLETVQNMHQEVAIGSYPVVGSYDYHSRLVVKGADRDRVAEVGQELREYVQTRTWLVREESDLS
ncbi:MAG: competence/damage-inducible protein A [Alkalispirochaeta sp.]